MDALDLAALIVRGAREHQQAPDGTHCGHCAAVWPCTSGALVAALETAERQRDQALAALARIENDKAATLDELEVSGMEDAADEGRVHDAQIIAAVARHTIGGNRD